jgi:uncharacterized membrane protein
MPLLIAGLILFLGSHSVRIFAAGWRDGVIARLGDGLWKGLYALVALAGFVLIIYGYGQARGGAPLYALPPQLLHATFGLVWLGFVFVVAAYWPANHIKHAVHDPMVAGVGLWALGHLLANASAAALALFGAFLVWAVADFVSLRQRGSSAGAPPKVVNTVLVVITGSVLAALFAGVLHVRLIGVSPFPGG